MHKISFGFKYTTQKDQKERHKTDPTLTQQQKIYTTRIQKEKIKNTKNSYWEDQEKYNKQIYKKLKITKKYNIPRQT